MDLLPAFRCLCSIAEHGSLTRAAAVLGTAPSVLSRQLASLEAEVGGRLFHRTGRGVLPTDLGRRLLPRAKAILAECDTVMTEMRGELVSPMGSVDLGVVPAVRPVVARLCARLQQEYPRIRLRAHEAFSGQIEQWIIDGRIDVGMYNRYGRASGRDAEPLLRSSMVVVARRGLPLVRHEEVAFRALAGVPMAIPIRPNALLTIMETTALRLQIQLAFAFESGSEAIIMDAVANAGMCAVVPRHVAARDHGAARYGWATITGPKLTQTTWMGQTSARPSTPAARTVAALLREMTPSLGEHGADRRAAA
jgi:LysR family transcriptional regulator, nitrogen assimilation regulatory protein